MLDSDWLLAAPIIGQCTLRAWVVSQFKAPRYRVKTTRGSFLSPAFSLCYFSIPTISGPGTHIRFHWKTLKEKFVFKNLPVHACRFFNRFCPSTRIRFHLKMQFSFPFWPFVRLARFPPLSRVRSLLLISRIAACNRAYSCARNVFKRNVV